MDYIMRWMVESDMAEVLAIDNDCYPTPWTMRELRAARRQHNVIARVCQISDTIAGYCIYELNKNNINIIRLAVDAGHRRRYVGARMVGDLASKLSQSRRNRLRIEVDERLLSGQLFLQALGFTASSVLRERCGDRDAFLMMYTHRDNVLSQD